MNVRLKAFIMIVCAVALGFFIGFLTRAVMQPHGLKPKHAREIHAGYGIIRSLERRLQLDSAQKKQLRPVLDRYDSALQDIQKTYHRQLRLTLDSLRTAIMPSLTETQRKRIPRPGDRPGFPPDFHPPRHEGPFHHGNTPGSAVSNVNPHRLHHERNREARFPGKDRVTFRYMRIIRPSETQRDTVTSLLHKYIKEHTGAFHDTCPEVLFKNDTLIAQLKHILSPEQMERINRMGGER